MYAGPFDCVAKAWRGEGFRGVQRGLGPAMIREFPKSGFRVGAYEPVLKRLHRDKGPPPMWKRFVVQLALVRSVDFSFE